MRPNLSALAVAGFAVALFVAVPVLVSGQPPARAYVLDSSTRTLTAIALPSGQRLGSLPVPGEPWTMVQGPDTSRLVIFDRGPGEEKGDRGYRSRGRSSATFVDPASLSVVGRVELGNGVEGGSWYFSPDGHRLAVLCPGYEAKNPAEAQAREIVDVDVIAAKESGRLTLEPGVVPVAVSPDGRSLALIQGLPRTDKYPYPRSRLHVVDLEGPTLRAQVDMGSWTNLYTDGTHFYLLDPGKPNKNPQKNRNGTVEVASVETGRVVAHLDAGREPRGLYPDETGAQVFIPSDGPPGSSGGELRVVRADAVAATLEVATDPKLLVRQGDVVYVVGEKAVSLIDPASLQVVGSIPLARDGEGLVGDGDLPTELQVSGDGTRACIHYGFAHKVAVLDLEAKRAIGSTKTGSGGKKLFGNMMGAMFGMAGTMAAGYGPWIYTAPRMLALRGDGRYAYAVNSQTKDVTVVDTATGRSQGTIGGGGYALEVLQDGLSMVEVSNSELRLIDLENNTKAGETPLPDLRGLFFPKDRSVAVALAKQVVLVLDGTSGREIARFTDFVSPDAIVFEPTP